MVQADDKPGEIQNGHLSDLQFACQEEADLANWIHIVCQFNDIPSETRKELVERFLLYKKAIKNTIIEECIVKLNLIMTDIPDWDINGISAIDQAIIDIHSIASNPVSETDSHSDQQKSEHDRT